MSFSYSRHLPYIIWTSSDIFIQMSLLVMHDRKHHFNYIHKPWSRQDFLSFSSLFSAIFRLFLLSTACTHPFCGFLPLTIFIHFLIHIVIHIFSAFWVYPQNVDNMWITFPIYSHFFSTFSKKSLFFNGFRPVDSVFFLIHITHISCFPHPSISTSSALSTLFFPHTHIPYFFVIFLTCS